MNFEVTLPDGSAWVPMFLTAIDHEKCIGCGRCYKACGRGVLGLAGVDEDGNFVPLEDGDDGEYEKKVMAILDPARCIGCEACSRMCAKKCHSHAALALA